MEISTTSQALTLAYSLACARNNVVLKRWVDISVKVGTRLPESFLADQIQHLGWLDVVIRSTESEWTIDKNQQSNADPFRDLILYQFSRIWITDAYEMLRVLKERQLEHGNEFEELCHHLRLIRIPLDKHEIAGHPKFNYRLRSVPPRPWDKEYIYSSKDPKRSYKMPFRVDPLRGTIEWFVADVIDDRSKPSTLCLSRLDISDRILALWAPEISPNPQPI